LGSQRQTALLGEISLFDGAVTLDPLILSHFVRHAMQSLPDDGGVSTGGYGDSSFAMPAALVWVARNEFRIVKQLSERDARSSLNF
jgi:hypothetical protein